jgi:hypothetical protein
MEFTNMEGPRKSQDYLLLPCAKSDDDGVAHSWLVVPPELGSKDVDDLDPNNWRSLDQLDADFPPETRAYKSDSHSLCFSCFVKAYPVLASELAEERASQD